MALLLQLGKGACAGPDEAGLPGGAGENGRDGVGVFEGVVTGVLLGVGGLDGGLPGGVLGGVEGGLLGGGADLGEVTVGGTEGAETGVLAVGRNVGRAGSGGTPAGVMAFEAVKAVGTCRGILAENALVAMRRKVKTRDFICLMLGHHTFCVQLLTHSIQRSKTIHSIKGMSRTTSLP